MGLRLLNLKRIMSDLSTNVFIVVDKEANILDFNVKAHDFLKSKSLLQHNLSEFFSSYLMNIFNPYFMDIAENQIPRSFVVDVHEKLFDCCIYPYSFGYVLSFDDITEFRDFSSYTTELTKRILHAEKVSEIGYFEIDLLSRKDFFSKELFKMLGFKKEVEENILKKQIYSKDKSKFEKSISRLLETGQKIELTLRFQGANEELISCLLKASLFKNEQENKVVGTVQDLSNYISSKKNLKEAKKKAEEASKAKSYFIVQASHDLRQPIQAIRMFLYSLKKEKMNEKQANIISNIDSSVEGLSYLLDNLMDISKLDYGGIKLHAYKFDLEKLIEKIKSEFEEIAVVKKIYFKVDVFPLEIYSDPFFIERIIRNLLGNAFKFTKNEVTLKYEKTCDDEVKISIKDNGIGISKKDKEYIFDEFYQTLSPNGKKKDGIGLGLPIVKKMTKALGGKIFVESKINKGSCFSIVIPIKKPAN